MHTYTCIVLTLPPGRSKLNLIVDDVSVSDPRDAAYVTSGYAPLSCRLAERMLVREWRSLYDVFGMLPGCVPGPSSSAHRREPLTPSLPSCQAPRRGRGGQHRCAGRR